MILHIEQSPSLGGTEAEVRAALYEAIYPSLGILPHGARRVSIDQQLCGLHRQRHAEYRLRHRVVEFARQATAFMCHRQLFHLRGRILQLAMCDLQFIEQPLILRLNRFGLLPDVRDLADEKTQCAVEAHHHQIDQRFEGRLLLGNHVHAKHREDVGSDPSETNAPPEDFDGVQTERNEQERKEIRAWRKRRQRHHKNRLQAEIHQRAKIAARPIE